MKHFHKSSFYPILGLYNDIFFLFTVPRFSGSSSPRLFSRWLSRLKKRDSFQLQGWESSHKAHHKNRHNCCETYRAVLWLSYMLLALIKSRENCRCLKYVWSEINLQRIQINFQNHALDFRWISEQLIPFCHKLKLLSRAFGAEVFLVCFRIFRQRVKRNAPTNVTAHRTSHSANKFFVMTKISHYDRALCGLYSYPSSHYAELRTAKIYILRDNIKWKKKLN